MVDPRLRELRHKLGRTGSDVKALLERHSGDIDAAVAEWQADYARVQREADKPRLLRRVPPVFTHSADERGQVLPPTAADIVEASEGSSYTDLNYRAVSDAGEAVDVATQNRITQEARERFAEGRRYRPEAQKAEARSTVNQLRDRQRRDMRSGRDLTPLHEAIRRVLVEWDEQREQEAA